MLPAFVQEEICPWDCVRFCFVWEQGVTNLRTDRQEDALKGNPKALVDSSVDSEKCLRQPLSYSLHLSASSTSILTIMKANGKTTFGKQAQDCVAYDGKATE